MLFHIILKNFRSNLKNYVLFFTSSIIAIAELFVFWGMNDIVKKAVNDEVTAEALKFDFQVAAGLMVFITVFLMIYAMQHYVRLRIKDYSMFVILGMKKRSSFFCSFWSTAQDAPHRWQQVWRQGSFCFTGPSGC